ncbi:MAG: flavodoxin family protein [Treponema sp.]|jgi:multimeric flavodoxin WrbA|nr:flavodoxin family protein [Treponema sp.]
MKVIAFNGSPHRNGTTSAGIGAITEELEKENITVETVHVGGEYVHGCAGCGKCRELKRCVFDDIVNQCIGKINQADGLILGSPVYYGGIAGTFKCFLDRLFFCGSDTKYKVAAVVAALRRSGGIAVHQSLCNYLNLGQMIITPTQYWSLIHGNSVQEALEDKEGMQVMRVTGRNMAWLLKAVADARQKALPPTEPRVWTNFIH